MSDFDLLVYGATGFTGQLVARYLSSVVPEGFRWAVAGRNPDKLDPIAKEAGVEAVIADSSDPPSVSAAVARARVVISTAGPFAKYGDPVVDACVEHGVHYVDITGETPWIRGLIDRHHERARAQGTRIIPCCGYDSIPSDLGTFMMARDLASQGKALARVDAYHVAKGGFSGGTLASLVNIIEQFPAKMLANPFLLDPDPRISREKWSEHADVRSPVYQPALQRWGAPFVMAAINTRVVRRSAALFAERQQPYGPDFAYQEYMEVKSRAAGIGVGLGLGVVVGGATFPLGRRLLSRLGPSPGEGPDEEARENGMMRSRYVATADDGSVQVGECFASGDPGYKVTSLMVSEAALTLALDGDAIGLGEEGTGGILTSATGLGEALLARLRAAGMRWQPRVEV